MAPSFDIATFNPEFYLRTEVTNNGQTEMIIRNIFDGELVRDKAWRGPASTEPIFLIFDALLIDKKNLIALPFN